MSTDVEIKCKAIEVVLKLVELHELRFQHGNDYTVEQVTEQFLKAVDLIAAKIKEPQDKK
ncbi:hypothetical protein [Treponema sp. Marseille-Q4130]|jgi:hypothetical protein|uniref:hypothetical protein n=1 Tax=Treponema sp. Marseille-Q4130 TaxID=2766702 RepID=UPI001652287B|nr:hypothetical protein [Treponema sp. Marseille-Q4130]MBC6720298.1 hypothetical protein [Treponema sp. Marseille-Q4130]